MAAAFDGEDSLMLAILPAGTRRKVLRWKTGFYNIALRAGVPIVLGYADSRRRVVGLGPTIHPTGDIEADYEAIRAFLHSDHGQVP